jgi:hypothetical protein
MANNYDTHRERFESLFKKFAVESNQRQKEASKNRRVTDQNKAKHKNK